MRSRLCCAARLREALLLFDELGYTPLIGSDLEAVGHLCSAQGRAEQAARFYGAVQRSRAKKKKFKTETTSEYTTGGGNNPFATGNTGEKETVSFATAQGAISVTRQENLDDDKRVIGYTFYTLDTEAYTLYGQEILDEPRARPVTSRQHGSL
ncbi:MAG: hypothetical protein H8F28_01050 [Fibrella sp.]|nr:hypothetical protein [Armatimonadota bacterium]